MNLDAIWNRHLRPLWRILSSWNDSTDWLLAGGAVVLALIVLEVLRTLSRGRLQRLAEKSPTVIDNVVVSVLAKTQHLFAVVIALAFGAWVLKVPKWVNGWVGEVVLVACVLQAALWAQAGLGTILERQRDRAESASTRTIVATFAFVGRLLIWSIVVVFVLANLGIEVTALLAGLGIGGVAAALAVQNVLGDMIAAVSLFFDRPFDLGDFVIVGSELGTVEGLNLRSTRVRALGGQLIVFANSDLAKSRIHNFGRMRERRVVFDFGVVYGTPYTKLERIPRLVREVVESLEAVRFDRSHFKGYGTYSLEFETVFYVLSPDYNEYMDRQQAVNLGIYERFEQEGIEFAFPTRTIHIAGAPESGGVGAAAVGADKR
jgi:small-conductance mechanosensitive channel